MNTLILLPPDQVDKARESDNPIGQMGQVAVTEWCLQNGPMQVIPENTMNAVTLSWSHSNYAEYGRSVQCREMERLLKDDARLVWCSVCDDGPSPNVQIMGWNYPVDVMAKGKVVTIKGIKHYQLPPFLVESMDTFFDESEGS